MRAPVSKGGASVRTGDVAAEEDSINTVPNVPCEATLTKANTTRDTFEPHLQSVTPADTRRKISAHSSHTIVTDIPCNASGRVGRGSPKTSPEVLRLHDKYNLCNSPGRRDRRSERTSSGDNTEEDYQPRSKMEKRDQPDTSDQHREIIDQFRSRVEGLVPEDQLEDQLLLQWLTARNFNLDKAETMFRKSQDWRQEHSLTDVMEWQPPEVLLKYSPVGLIGNDKYGGTVMIVPHGRVDIRGLLMSSKKAEHIRYTAQTLEKSKALMAEESKRRGTTVCQQTCIFDLEGFSIKEFTWKPALELVVDQMQMYEANYPELLRCAYVINAPKMFTVAYAIIKPFLHEATIKKIQIFGKTGWKELLLRDIDAHVLPKHWGGTRVDPDGDEMCSSIICLGGHVPQSYYTKNRLKDHRQNFTTVTVNKGDKEKFPLIVTQADTIIKWEFETEDYDIGFSINCDGEDVHTLHRVNSHLSPDEGQLLCNKPGTYTVIFDNSFSYMRSKKLHYSLDVLQPSTK